MVFRFRANVGVRQLQQVGNGHAHGDGSRSDTCHGGSLREVGYDGMRELCLYESPDLRVAQHQAVVGVYW